MERLYSHMNTSLLVMEINKCVKRKTKFSSKNIRWIFTATTNRPSEDTNNFWSIDREGTFSLYEIVVSFYVKIYMSANRSRAFYTGRHYKNMLGRGKLMRNKINIRCIDALTQSYTNTGELNLLQYNSKKMHIGINFHRLNGSWYSIKYI